MDNEGSRLSLGYSARPGHTTGEIFEPRLSSALSWNRRLCFADKQPVAIAYEILETEVIHGTLNFLEFCNSIFIFIHFYINTVCCGVLGPFSISPGVHPDHTTQL